MPIDPRFQEQARTFIVETMKQVIPGANVDGGSAINTVFARGAAAISSVLHQEIEHLLTSRDLSEPESMTDGDLDLLLANLLVERDTGDLSFGFVRLFYSDRVDRSFSRGLTATTEDSALNFVTIADLAFRTEDYFVDEDSGEFFLNVPFTSEEAGEEYNVDIGEISKLTNDSSGALRVTNVSVFANGKARQSNTEAVATASRSVSTRVPVSRDGAVFFMQQLFRGKLRNLLVVGAGDDEMMRDELYDMGPSTNPRFQIGRESLGGAAMNVHVGGRTDVYSLFETINYIQQHVDIFADMRLVSIGPPTTLVASMAVGTTGVVAAQGKLILDLGTASEETVSYSSRTTVDNVTFTFTLDSAAINSHAANAVVKAVNNGRLTIAPDGDVTVLPVFKIQEIRLLDPVTFQVIGDPIPESSAESREPGWYIADSNAFDILSAMEHKVLVMDEKRDTDGNAPSSGVNGSLVDVVIGGVGYSLYACAGVDFTGYQGRSISLSGAVAATTRSILDVVSATQVIVSGPAMGAVASGVDFSVPDYRGDLISYPVRISYYTNTELAEAQDAFNQDGKRIISGDILSRSFMPVFLDFVFRYRGDGEVSQVRDALNEILKSSAGEALGESSSAQFDFSDLVSAAYVNDAANYVQTPFQVRVRRLNFDGTTTTRYMFPAPDVYGNLAVRLAPGVEFFAADLSWTLGGSDITSAGAHIFTNPTDIGRRIFVDGEPAVITAFVNGSTVTIDRVFTASAAGQDWSFTSFFLEAKRPTQVPAFNVPEKGRLYLGGFTSSQESMTYDSVIVSGVNYTFVLSQGMRFTHDVNEPLKVSTLDFDPELVITDGVITDERVYRPYFGDVVVEKLS